MRSVRRFCLLAAAVLLVVASAAQANDDGYRLPPQTIVDLIDRPPTPQVRLSPDREWLLLLTQPSLPPVAELAEPELRLGGLRFKPGNNGPSRNRPAVGLELVRVADGEARPVRGLPENPRIDGVAFSPDSRHVAFTQTGAETIELWVVDVAAAAARRLSEAALNLTALDEPLWASDNETLLVPLVPGGRGAPPPSPQVPGGPVIQKNLGAISPARTYQDLLKSPHDEALFEHYLTAQLAAVGLDGEVKRLGEPGALWGFDPSPDGRYVLVERLVRPFSYLVPAWRFPQQVEVWDRDGKLVKRIADLPLHESVPIAFGSVPTGPRRFTWRADAPATVSWVEAMDGGDAGREAEHRDRLFLLPAPFEETRAWAKLKTRVAGVQWGRGDLALVVERWWKTRGQRVSRVRPDHPDAPAELLVERSYQDRYSDPGRPLMHANAAGRFVLTTGDGGDTLYLTGPGASPEGDRPFLDTYDLETKQTRRLFHSAAPHYEAPVDLLADGLLLTRRESVEEPPNFFLRPLKGKDEPRALTSFPHPTPELAGIQKEIVHYQRDDGVDLTATLYLPPGYKAEDGPLPMLAWAYPREYKSAAAAAQVRDSPYRFDRVSWRSPILWLTLGYAVLDDPAMPIVGEGDAQPNDTFREQLVGSARAAVDEMVRRGVADPKRIAIAGHSYGAFMTANLLAHSDLFAAGIARSGAYNRTLTPFGFQAEERTFWEAPEIYFKMSPFMHAEKVDEPLLLIHGAADNNSGTFPMQSERFYAALKGHGATARLVMLPHESHGYRARESILHMLWETHEWLERYVKNGPIPSGD